MRAGRGPRGVEPLRPLSAVVDLERIRRNVSRLKGVIPDGCLLMAVVKANAYGHGDVEVSEAALRAGADRLGVALVEEALSLRRAGFGVPIHVLFEPPVEGADIVVENDLICSVYTPGTARSLSDAAVRSGKDLRVHIKVDTGMRRVGIYPERASEFAEFIGRLPRLQVEGIYTHFAVADKPDDEFTERQMDLFDRACADVEKALGRTLLRHAANSAGVMRYQRSHYDMVRVGIAMYGLPPSSGFPDTVGLLPALSLGGRTALVKKVRAGEGISYGLTHAPDRDTFVATIPIGYADGMSRLLSGKAEVLIGGVRRPVLGTICMDMCMVDLGPEQTGWGEEFVIIGRQGDQEITATEVAERLGTINYEILCMIGPRVPRIYVGRK